MQKVAIFSKKILNIKSLNHFFSDLFFISNKEIEQADAIAGWGQRPTTNKARQYALKHSLPFISLEDGFLRSIGLGLDGFSPLSMVADDIGIYYDSNTPSQLEHLIKQKQLLEQHAKQAKLAMQLIVNAELSKYNHAPDFMGFNDADNENIEKVLVIDQTLGDMAVKLGGADQQTFINMLNAAIAENPTSKIYVKTHPDVINGYKQGYLTQEINSASIILLGDDTSPISLLKQVDKVYVVTSHMGFEALLLGKKVITYGLPWYAGWGITDDRHVDIEYLHSSQRRTQATCLELFTASYMLYCQYINPNTGEKGSIFDVINYLTKVKRLNNKLRGSISIIGLSFWKKRVLSPYLKLPSVKYHFYSIKSYRNMIANTNRANSTSAPKQENLLIWGYGKKDLLPIIQKNKLSPFRMEDGFIRSIGLGSNLVMPYSLVIDNQGIYFNSQQESELESLLQHKILTEEEKNKADALQQLLIKTKLGKYNVGKKQKIVPNNCNNKIILIPGQVEDDASILYGSPVIKTNFELIKAVRETNPTDYIIYKPHPDVLSGNRKGIVEQCHLEKYVDSIIELADMIDCIEQVDEVHTMTSLAGFEALIRYKKVVCYGQPFYAGWGLTVDKFPISRRTRSLTLDELIYIVMYEYAIYIHPDTLDYTDPQTLTLYLYQQKQKYTSAIKQNWLKKQSNKLKQVIWLMLQTKLK